MMAINYRSLLWVPVLVLTGLAVAEETETFEGKPVRYWVDQLQNGTASERIHASHALSKIGTGASPAVTVITAALDDPNEHVRRNAASALGQIGPYAAVAVDKLIVALRDETDADLRRSAARALGAIGPDAELAVEELTNALADPDFFVRANAAKALGQIGAVSVPSVGALIQKLSDENLYVRRAAADALGQLGLHVIPALVDALKDEDEEVRFRAAKALGVIGAPAVVPLSKALQDKQAVLREGAARALVYMQWPITGASPEAAIPDLIHVLKDEDPDVRLWSIKALGQMGPKSRSAVEPLIDRLNDHDYYLWYEALVALARIGQPAVPHLIEALKDKSAKVRAGAAGALGNVRPPLRNTEEHLAMLLRDKEATVRFWAADGLAGIGIIPDLVVLLAEEEPTIRSGAVYAMGRWYKKWNPASLRLSGTTARSAPIKMSITALTRALQDEEVTIRRVAAESLGYFGRTLSRGGFNYAEAALPSLKKAMQDVDPTVRFRAAKALAYIDDDRPGIYEAQAQHIANSEKIAPYYGFAQDVKMLRKTYEAEGPRRKASSGAAIAAAHRIFGDTPFKGMTRVRVLEVLGNPKTISAYGQAAALDLDSPLIYRFDSGYGGLQCTLRFRNRRVQGLEIVGMN